MSESGASRASDKNSFWFGVGLTYLWAMSGLLIPALGYLQRKSDTKVFSSIDIDDLLSGRLGLDLLSYLGALLLLYLALAWVIWWLSGNLGRRLRLDSSGRLLLHLFVWVVSVTWLQLLNARLFPRSKVMYFDQDFAVSDAGAWLLYLQGGVVALIVVFGLLSFIADAGRRRPKGAYVLSLAAAGLATLVAYHNLAAGGRTKQANVIFIGVDSLRTDAVGFLHPEVKSTPNLDRFLSGSSVFSNAYTPLARTYPAWMSILTGKYPRHHGVRYNLIAPKLANTQSSIAWSFGAEGYETVLAMDERRFANIDQKHGFVAEIGPGVGAGDFLLASVNDTPLTNLLLSTFVGEYLFPFNYLNRAVDHLYYPEDFDHRLADSLASRDPGRPLFLVSHFCVPHWPYVWARVPANKGNARENRLYRYQQAVGKADDQFGRLMAALETSGLLENAVVVLLSDHGESLGDGVQGSGRSTMETLLTREEWGHGTNVFRDDQYKVLLAVRGYGEFAWIGSRSIDTPVSLVDLAPTLIDLFSLAVDSDDSRSDFDGISLRGYLEGRPPAAQRRPIFVESGFSVPAILAVDPSLQDVFRQGFQHYRVNPENGRLEVKDDSHQSILDAKQRGVLLDQWQLVAAKDEEGGGLEYGLRHLGDGSWTDDLNDELARQAPVDEMRALLFEHFGDELHPQDPSRLVVAAGPSP